jgi:hypothetical protein
VKMEISVLAKVSSVYHITITTTSKGVPLSQSDVAENISHKIASFISSAQLMGIRTDVVLCLCVAGLWFIAHIKHRLALICHYVHIHVYTKVKRDPK